MRYSVFLALLAWLAAACNPGAADPTDKPTFEAPPEAATATREPTPTPPPPSPTASPSPAPTPSAPTPEEALSPAGPWGVFLSGEGVWADAIWAVNPDGSGLTAFRLPERHIAKPRDLAAAVSPAGGHMAFVSAADANPLSGLALNLLTLPAGEIRTLTPLSSGATELEEGADPAQRPPEPLLAITQENSVAWSPDGRSLAFMAAFEGPSSDLYVYSLEDGAITRLTDGPSQGIRPIWSPDSERILHMGVDNLGTGAGYEMAGVWAARADGTGVTTLYEDPGSADEVFVGWISDETFVVFSVPFGSGGGMNLRAVDVESGAVDVLWEGAFSAVALDPEGGNLLVLVGEDAARRDPGVQVGLHFIPAGGAPLRILEDEPYRVDWSSGTGLFFARTEFGVVAVSSSGDWRQLHDFTGRLPVASPVAMELAWYGEGGLWVGNLISSLDLPQPEQIFQEPVHHVAWGPEGRHLLFFGGGGLYVLHQPDLTPMLVAENLMSLESAWVRP